jgi:hypothetical protein
MVASYTYYGNENADEIKIILQNILKWISCFYPRQLITFFNFTVEKTE